MRRGGSSICWASILFVTAIATASSKEATKPPGLAGKLGDRIEISQHEQLVRTRSATGAGLAPFVSDGCSGGLSVGWSFVSTTFPLIARYHGDRPPWEHCCYAHDKIYHSGGPAGADAKASFEARREADEQLHRCVSEVGEERTEDLANAYGLSHEQIAMLYRTIADIMYKAVRLGGAPCTLLPWRWGFGWPQCKSS